MRPESLYRLHGLPRSEGDPRIEAIRILSRVLSGDPDTTGWTHVHNVCRLRRRRDTKRRAGVRLRPRPAQHNRVAGFVMHMQAGPGGS